MIPVLMSLAIELCGKRGKATVQGELVEMPIDSEWRMAINGKKETARSSWGMEIEPFHIHFDNPRYFAACALVGPGGGITIGAGVEEAIEAALKNAIDAENEKEPA